MPSIINATTTNGLVTSADNSGSLQLQTNNGTTAVTIDTSQNVGVGTTTINDKLVVQSSSAEQGITIRGDGLDAIKIGMVNPSVSNDGVIGMKINNALRFITNNTERMRITSDGKVGIGTNSPSGVLDVRGGSGIAVQGRGTGTNSRSFEGVQSNASYAEPVGVFQTTRTANSAFSFLWCESDATSVFDKEFILRGDGNAYADGTWNNNGADYAEYFESATGQTIPVGSTVVLENNKVRLATESDNPSDVIGVVRPKEPSKASMVVGNTAWNKWANKYLTDDFDRYIMEDHDVVEWTDENGELRSYESQQITADVVVPADAVRKSHDENGKKYQHYKLNPAWNPDAEYINRENRDEWVIVGLVGQVKVLKGQKMGNRWKKMRDVSDSVEEWFIR